MFTYNLSIFLTSTAFVDTKAKTAYLFRDMPYFEKLSLRVPLYIHALFLTDASPPPATIRS